MASPTKKTRSAVAKAKPHRPPVKARKNTFTDDGLVLICDIVDFSRLHHDMQALAVDRLWSFLKVGRNRPLLANRKSYVVNGTGDGLMLAYVSDNVVFRHQQFIEFAAGLVPHMLAGEPPFQLRVGINQGPFGFVRPPGSKTRQAVGTGINQCARIVAVGDSGTVTVSEDFVNKWSKRSGADIRKYFVPAPAKPAHDVVIKRGEVFSLRFYAPVGGGLHSASKKIESFHVVRSLITRQLVAMEAALIGLLYEAQPALKETPLDIRISVLTERLHDHVGRALCTTDYRHHARDHAIKASNTAYPMTDKGSSPAGHAYQTNSVCVIYGLPEWLSTQPATQDEYHRQFVTNRPYSPLNRDIVNGFSRHARAYHSFPFSLMKADPANGQYPDGVICIDILQPLEGFTEEQLTAFTKQLQTKYSDALALLWRLRGQL